MDRLATARKAGRTGATPQWLVTLRPDGVVDTVEGAPVTWVGHSLIGHPSVPEAVRQAARELMDAPSRSYLRRRRVLCREAKRDVEVELLLVEGLPLRRAHTRIDQLIMRTLDVFVTQAASSEVDLTIEQAPDVPASMFIDGEKIAWALATLVGNALRFLQRRIDDGKRAHVHVHVRWDDPGELAILVQDTGPGMSEHQSRWLFDRDPITGKSQGLALMMVRDVMSAHRGSVSVESTVGHGTAFVLRIPHAEVSS